MIETAAIDTVSVCCRQVVDQPASAVSLTQWRSQSDYCDRCNLPAQPAFT